MLKTAARIACTCRSVPDAHSAQNGLTKHSRTRVVGTFPDGRSALMLVTARLKYVAESEWGSRRYLDVTLLEG